MVILRIMENKNNKYDENEGKWTILSSEYLFKRPWLTARRDKVQLPNGVVNDEFYVLEYPDWVNVLAITDEGKFVMIRQYRHGLGSTHFEIPAGVVEEGESPLQAAQRELLEETGFSGGEWTKLTSISANASCTSNITHCYLAVGVESTGEQHLEATEDISVHLLNEEMVKILLVNDDIKQATMTTPLWQYFMLKALSR